MRTAPEIRNLKTREAKCWRVLDQMIAESDRKKVPAVVRLEAVLFVLKRLYPEKTVIGGDGKDGAIILRVVEGNPEENGNQLQAARFSISGV